MISMYRHRVPVKVNRRTARVTAPFGRGLIGYTPEFDRRGHDVSDELWWAAETGGDAPTDAEIDAWAAERELEERYDRACELITHCIQCGRPDDFIDPQTFMCPPCDIAASEAHDERMARRAW